MFRAVATAVFTEGVEFLFRRSVDRHLTSDPKRCPLRSECFRACVLGLHHQNLPVFAFNDKEFSYFSLFVNRQTMLETTPAKQQMWLG